MVSRIEGLKELSDQLSKLEKNAGGKALRSALFQSSLPVVKKARVNAPVGAVPHKTYKGRLVSPGFLSRNIARKSRLSKDRRTAFVFIGVKPEAFYGLQFLELGTSRIRKRPWLSKSLELSQGEVIQRFKERLKKKIEQLAK